MALIKWSPELMLGIPKMDVEHQHLIALVNTMHDMFERGKRGHALHRVLRELVEAASVHFEFEEIFLAEQGYPGIEDHKDEHKVLMGQLLELESELTSGKKTISAETFEYLCDWVVDHIVNADRDVATHVREVEVH